MNTHEQARANAASALSMMLRQPAERGAIICLTGVGWLETGYSSQWTLTRKNPALDPHNMGAIQCGTGWTGASFEATDTHPNPDGTSTPYPAAFRLYPKAIDVYGKRTAGGWNDLAYVMYAGNRSPVLQAAQRGDVWDVSEALYHTHYYEGFGRSDFERIWHHWTALTKAIHLADRAVGDTLTDIKYEPPADLIQSLPVLRVGTSGPAVKVLQWELDVAADGNFGPLTLQAVKDYQLRKALTIDGIVGHATWYSLLNDDFTPEVSV